MDLRRLLECHRAKPSDVRGTRLLITIILAKSYDVCSSMTTDFPEASARDPLRSCTSYETGRSFNSRRGVGLVPDQGSPASSV